MATGSSDRTTHPAATASVRPRAAFAVLAVLALVGGCTQPLPARPDPAPATKGPPPSDAGARLVHLLADSDAGHLRRNPIEALLRGDLSDAGRFGGEVARIQAAMEGLRQRIGFRGSLVELQAAMRTDPRFRPASVAALGDRYREIGQRVEAAMPRLFPALSRTRLEIRPTPAYQEKTDAPARYTSGSADASRPGVLCFNSYDLPRRATYTMEATYLHEAMPGHRYQSRLTQENEALPKALRFGGHTAYNEGWALYAESLGPELGLQTDPYQRTGAYDFEMLRAARLVVDTGIHAFGWSRDRAIEYLLVHGAQGRTEAVAEVERYIADPGQALAYKVGELTIRRLRGEAEAALGPRFDARQFHREVLDTGSLPLDVLEAKIRSWIDAQRPR